MSSTPSSQPAHLQPVLSAAQEILADLAHFKHEKWGWVIYRTWYGDNAAWARFQEDVRAQVSHLDAKTLPPEARARLHLTFVSDSASLAGASLDTLRRRFWAWAADAERSENPRADGAPEQGEPRAQRYAYFVAVDEEAMQGVVAGRGADDGGDRGRPSDPGGQVTLKLVRADKDQDTAEIRAVNAREAAVDGHMEQEVDEGWMVIGIDMLVAPEFYNVLGQMPENWYAYYTAPPDVASY